MSGGQPVPPSLEGVIADLQKRLYALEREVRTMRVTYKPERRPR